MVQFSYLVVGTSEPNVKVMQSYFEGFHEYFYIGSAINGEDAVNMILELQPDIVFLELPPKIKNHSPLKFITDLHQYINALPYIIVWSDSDAFAFEAIKAGVNDYLIKPVPSIELRKSLLRFRKSAMAQHPVTIYPHPLNETEKESEQELYVQNEAQRSEIDIQICIKSYGDYQFIALKDVLYLKADNNTTDFYLFNGKKLTAYKTLKHYENNLPSFFYRIHNSYIVNSNYVSRINTGKQLCYLNNNEISVSFSKTFKDNIDTVIRNIAPEYL